MGLELNVKKSKIMEFMKAGGRRQETVFLQETGKEIERVNEFKYLGQITVTKNIADTQREKAGVKQEQYGGCERESSSIAGRKE